MKISEARQTYSSQIKNYYAKEKELSDQRVALERKMRTTVDGQKVFEKEAATLELAYTAISEKRQEYQDYMDMLQEQWASVANLVSSEQQGDAMADAANEQGKIIEVARRIMRGDRVPAYDEKKLMEFDWKLYSMAKSAAAMLELQKKRKEHKSLWEDEEEKTYDDPVEVADNTEAFASGPEVVDVEATLESVEVEE
ncbi:MAG: hypothetical protein MJ123_00440 [Lachnospiraceae bacterium]|nr:hypothetical protein [Lachnospiraceae bacterium]